MSFPNTPPETVSIPRFRPCVIRIWVGSDNFCLYLEKFFVYRSNYWELVVEVVVFHASQNLVVRHNMDFGVFNFFAPVHFFLYLFGGLVR